MTRSGGRHRPGCGSPRAFRWLQAAGLAALPAAACLGQSGRPGPEATEDPPSAYAPGTTIAPGRPEAGAYLGRGWSGPEGDYRWTDGGTAVVRLGLPADRARLLRIALEPFLEPPRLTRQRVTVAVNGVEAAAVSLTERAPRTTTILLPEAPRGAETQVTLATPDATAPSALGPSADTRRLGVAVHWLRIDAVAELPAGGGLALGAGEADAFLGAGWGDAEEDGYRWTIGAGAELAFSLPAEARRSPPSVLRLRAMPFLAPPRLPSQRLRIVLNGRPLPEVTLTRPGVANCPFALPPGSLGAVNVVRIEAPDAASPHEAGASDDPRRLGFAVFGLALEP